jgi:hypothetical protein
MSTTPTLTPAAACAAQALEELEEIAGMMVAEVRRTHVPTATAKLMQLALVAERVGRRIVKMVDALDPAQPARRAHR